MLRVAKKSLSMCTATCGVFLCASLLLVTAVAPEAADSQEGKDSAADSAEAKAEEKSAKAKEASETVRTGVIATTGSYGFENTGVDSDATGSAPGDEEPSVISGSVSMKSRDECLSQVTNTSPENSYSVSYRVIGRNDRGSKVFSKGFARSLKPGQVDTRDFRCDPNWKMEVELRSAKKR